MNIKELHIGTSAPDASLTNEQGTSTRLSDLWKQGGLVIVFYPGDQTPGCTIQLCAFRDDWEKFRELGLSIVGVNHGNSDSHKQFSEKHHFPFPLLVDAQKRVAKLYGSVYSFLGFTLIRRMVVGIDRDGTVRYIRHGMPRHADILKALKPYAINTKTS